MCASIGRKEINLNVNKILFLDQSAVTMAHEHVQEPDIGEQEIVFIDEGKCQTQSQVKIWMVICPGVCES